MLTLPELFKKNSDGSMQRWLCAVDGAAITRRYGKVGGAEMTTSDTVREGKNLGRANATTPEQQALLEAQSEWTQKLKKGYHEDAAAAGRGEVDAEAICGGSGVMLAKDWDDHKGKVVYPVAVQPKLDGHRCLAEVTVDQIPTEGGVGLSVDVTLWSRTRRPIRSMPHVISEIRSMVLAATPSTLLALSGVAVADFAVGRSLSFWLDGELYTHELKADFEKLSSLIRPDEPREGHEQIQYHVYDTFPDGPEECPGFEVRFPRLEPLLTTEEYVRLVDTTPSVQDEAGVLAEHDARVADGYEGCMVRRLGVGYEKKRTSQLLKVKRFRDAEYRVVGLAEGRGKLAGHVGAFVCEVPATATQPRREFSVKLAGETSLLRLDLNQDKIGKRLTVKYQGITADGSLRFPVGLRFVD